MTLAMRIELYKYKSNTMKWSWRLRHRNGKVLANAAESYSDKTAARRAAIKLHKHLGGVYPVVEMTAEGAVVIQDSA